MLKVPVSFQWGKLFSLVDKLRLYDSKVYAELRRALDLIHDAAEAQGFSGTREIFDFGTHFDQICDLKYTLEQQRVSYADGVTADVYQTLGGIVKAIEIMREKENTLRWKLLEKRDRRFISNKVEHSLELITAGINPFEEVSQAYIIDYHRIPELIDEWHNVFAQTYCLEHLIVAGDTLEELRELSHRKYRHQSEINISLATQSVLDLREYFSNFSTEVTPDFGTFILPKEIVTIHNNYFGKLPEMPVKIIETGSNLEMTPKPHLILCKDEQSLEFEHYATKTHIKNSQVRILTDHEREIAVVSITGETPLGLPLAGEIIKKYVAENEYLSRTHEETGLPMHVLAYFYSESITDIELLDVSSWSTLFRAQHKEEPVVIKVYRKAPETCIRSKREAERLLSAVHGYTIKTDRGPQPIESYLPTILKNPRNLDPEKEVVVLEDFSNDPTTNEEPNLETLIQVYSALHADMLTNITQYFSCIYRKSQPSFSKVADALAAGPFSSILPDIFSLETPYNEGLQLSSGEFLLSYDVLGNSIGNKVFDHHEAQLTSFSNFFSSFFLHLDIKDETVMRKAIALYEANYVNHAAQRGVDAYEYIGEASPFKTFDVETILGEIPYVTLFIQLRELAFGRKVKETLLAYKFIGDINQYSANKSSLTAS